MRVLQGWAHLKGRIEDFFPGKSALSLQDLFQALALDVFHGIIEMALLGPRLVKANDVGMAELSEDLDLPLKALKEARLLSQLGGEHLERGSRLSVHILCQVTRAHAAKSNVLCNQPSSQACSNHQLLAPEFADESGWAEPDGRRQPSSQHIPSARPFPYNGADRSPVGT